MLLINGQEASLQDLENLELKWNYVVVDLKPKISFTCWIPPDDAQRLKFVATIKELLSTSEVRKKAQSSP